MLSVLIVIGNGKNQYRLIGIGTTRCRYLDAFPYCVSNAYSGCLQCILLWVCRSKQWATYSPPPPHLFFKTANPTPHPLEKCLYDLLFICVPVCLFPSQDLDALLEKDRALEEESKNLTESLDKQKEKYKQLQVH